MVNPVISPARPAFVIGQCRVCNGSGSVRTAVFVPCATCKSTGKCIHCSRPTSAGLRCGACKGQLSCHLCDGEGEVEYSARCPSCLLSPPFDENWVHKCPETGCGGVLYMMTCEDFRASCGRCDQEAISPFAVRCSGCRLVMCGSCAASLTQCQVCHGTTKLREVVKCMRCGGLGACMTCQKVGDDGSVSSKARVGCGCVMNGVPKRCATCRGYGGHTSYDSRPCRACESNAGDAEAGAEVDEDVLRHPCSVCCGQGVIGGVETLMRPGAPCRNVSCNGVMRQMCAVMGGRTVVAKEDRRAYGLILPSVAAKLRVLGVQKDATKSTPATGASASKPPVPAARRFGGSYLKLVNDAAEENVAEHKAVPLAPPVEMERSFACSICRGLYDAGRGEALQCSECAMAVCGLDECRVSTAVPCRSCARPYPPPMLRPRCLPPALPRHAGVFVPPPTRTAVAASRLLDEHALGAAEVMEAFEKHVAKVMEGLAAIAQSRADAASGEARTASRTSRKALSRKNTMKGMGSRKQSIRKLVPQSRVWEHPPLGLVALAEAAGDTLSAVKAQQVPACPAVAALLAATFKPDKKPSGKSIRHNSAEGAARRSVQSGQPSRTGSAAAKEVRIASS